MSIEIYLYAKTSSKTGLIKFLTNNGFQKVKHIIESFNNDDNLHYMWFGRNDFESNDGVEASIMKASDEIKTKYSCSDWILHTRTRASGSYEDKAKQNEIIRNARKLFGGTFYNDWYGTNKYIDLVDYKKLLPLEKAIIIIKENSFEKLKQITHCLENYNNPISEHIQSLTNNPLSHLIKQKDPSIVLYNSLIPFLIAITEFFFCETFIVYITYDDFAKKIIAEEKLKVSIEEIIRIQNSETSLERIIAETYNFQNLESINKAYKRYLNIDIFSILSKKKKVGNKVFRILSRFETIIKSRHKIIHDLEFNYSLTKEEYLLNVETIEKTIELVIEEIQHKKNLKI